MGMNSDSFFGTTWVFIVKMDESVVAGNNGNQ